MHWSSSRPTITDHRCSYHSCCFAILLVFAVVGCKAHEACRYADQLRCMDDSLNSNSVNNNTYSEVFGADSHCFVVVDPEFEKELCYRMICDASDTALKIDVAGEWVSCNATSGDGTHGDVPLDLDFFPANAMFVCPPLWTVCPDLQAQPGVIGGPVDTQAPNPTPPPESTSAPEAPSSTTGDAAESPPSSTGATSSPSSTQSSPDDTSSANDQLYVTLSLQLVGFLPVVFRLW